MIDFGESDKMIKISGKVDKPTLTMNSAMIFCDYEISKLLNLLSVLVYPIFYSIKINECRSIECFSVHQRKKWTCVMDILICISNILDSLFF